MRWSSSSLAAASLLLLVAGCDRVPADAVTRCEARSIRGAAKTDILFVIDDSGSMSEEQAAVRAGLDAFVNALASSPVRNDFQIGVTTTSVEDFVAAIGSYGATTPNAGVPFPAGALVAVRPNADPNAEPAFDYDPALATQNPLAGFTGRRVLSAGSPTLVQDFMTNVVVGVHGTGKEQPFRAARLALTDRVADGVNAGFLRPGARLAVVFVTDEDDCSDTARIIPDDGTGNNACHDDRTKGQIDAVDDFVAFLRGPIDGEAREVVAAVIAGVDPATLAPSCGYPQCADQACGTAFDEADRLGALTAAMGSLRTRVGSICDASFAGSLATIADLLVPQSMTLEGAPADWRMLAVRVDRVDGTHVACDVALEGAAGAADADAVYTPPLAGRPATLTFQHDCTLAQGDAVDVRIVCAG